VGETKTLSPLSGGGANKQCARSTVRTKLRGWGSEMGMEAPQGPCCYIPNGGKIGEGTYTGVHAWERCLGAINGQVRWALSRNTFWEG